MPLTTLYQITSPSAILSAPLFSWALTWYCTFSRGWPHVMQIWEYLVHCQSICSWCLVNIICNLYPWIIEPIPANTIHTFHHKSGKSLTQSLRADPTNISQAQGNCICLPYQGMAKCRLSSDFIFSLIGQLLGMPHLTRQVITTGTKWDEDLGYLFWHTPLSSGWPQKLFGNPTVQYIIYQCLTNIGSDLYITTWEVVNNLTNPDDIILINPCHFCIIKKTVFVLSWISCSLALWLLCSDPLDCRRDVSMDHQHMLLVPNHTDSNYGPHGMCWEGMSPHPWFPQHHCEPWGWLVCVPALLWSFEHVRSSSMVHDTPIPPEDLGMLFH